MTPAPRWPTLGPPIGDAEAVIVVAGDGMVVGEIDAEALPGLAADAAVLDVMDPVPTTVRPSVTVAALAEAGGGSRLVTHIRRPAPRPGDGRGRGP